MKAAAIAMVLGLAPLAALAQDVSPSVLSKDDAKAMASLMGKKVRTERAKLKTLSRQQISDALTENLSDVTKIIYQPGYGVFIEYTAADGRDRMWFPGNTGAVKGIWGLREIRNVPRVCFHYFNSVNAVTGEIENSECIQPEQTLSGANVIDKRPGDVFNLLSDKIPYQKGGMSIPSWPETK